MGFEPWVGPLYRTEGLGGRRLMILAESHIGPPGRETPTFTQRLIQLRGVEMRDPFLMKVASLVLQVPVGTVLSTAARMRFWRSVAYYTFVPVFPGERPRTRPSGEMFRRGQALLPAVVHKLDPALLLVLGKELAGHLPPSLAVPTCIVANPLVPGFQMSASQALVADALAALPATH